MCVGGKITNGGETSYFFGCREPRDIEATIRHACAGNPIIEQGSEARVSCCETDGCMPKVPGVSIAAEGSPPKKKTNVGFHCPSYEGSNPPSIMSTEQCDPGANVCIGIKANLRNGTIYYKFTCARPQASIEVMRSECRQYCSSPLERPELTVNACCCESNKCMPELSGISSVVEGSSTGKKSAGLVIISTATFFLL